MPTPTNVRTRLISSLDSLIDSFHKDDLYEVLDSWNDLERDIVTRRDTGSLDIDTAQLAFDVVDCMEVLCDAFPTFNLIEDSFKDAMSQITRSTDDISPSSSTSLHESTPEPEQTSISSSPYVRDAYEWLLENLHNPYPSPAQRDAISFKSGASRKSIDNWFIDVRKRIGWNVVKKKYFKERKDMIAAACIFIRGDEPDTTDKKQPDYPADLGIAFAEIRGKALDLYGNGTEASHLVQKLAGQVKTLTPELQEELAKDRREEKLKRRRVAHKRQSSSSSSAEESTPTPPAGKRRRSDDDESDSSSRKRSRDEEASEALPSTPSPGTSTTVDAAPPPSTSTASPTPFTQPEPGSKKRRLVSDSDATPRAAKRSRMTYPMGRAASVPITLPVPKFPVEDWFTQPLPTVDQWPADKLNFTFGTTEYFSDLETLLSDGSESGSSNGSGPSTPAAPESLQLGIAPSETTLSSSTSCYDFSNDFEAGLDVDINQLLNNFSNPTMGVGIGIVDPNASHLLDTFSGAQTSSSLPDLGFDFTNFPLESWATDLNTSTGFEGCSSSLALPGFEAQEQSYLQLSQVVW